VFEIWGYSGTDVIYGGERPDCSGKLETTTGIYTDIIQSGDDIFQTTFSLTDPANLTLTLESYEPLTH
jgi:hypothetical protein